MGDTISSISDGEKQLLDRISAGDLQAAKTLVERYLKLFFRFSITFAPFSREQAFNITVSSFAKTLQTKPQISRDGEWMPALFREGLAECVRTSPSGNAEFHKENLKMIREAFIKLSPNDKATLLFRDQCHFSFEMIAAIFGSSAAESQSACMAARERFRGAVKEILDRSSGADHGM